MDKRLPLLIRQAMFNLRGGFLVRPLTIALALGCAGAILSWLEETFPSVSDLVPAALFPSHSDPQVAQIILGGIAASIMTVVSIVFAILLMTLTLASMQFSPRIIVSFARDRVTQWTLGIFLGTFCYCMAALPAARSLPHPFAPVATVLGAMLLALACVAWLLFFIHHISQAISVSHIVDRIASETEAMIDEMMPWPHRLDALADPHLLEPGTWETPVVSQASGYIRYIDTTRLVDLAKAYHVKVNIVRRVGQFVPAGARLLMVYRGSRLSPESRDELLGTVDLGPSRTLQQDIEFGVLQIVDIALKAISPAVNDPSTGVSCVDQLSRILIRFASREPPATLLYDPPGVVRASIHWIDFDGLLTSAFEQIRLYSRADIAVSLRLLRALGDIATTTADPEYRVRLRDLGRRIVQGCAEQLGEEEVGLMRVRLAVLEESANAPPHPADAPNAASAP
ncbi:MAG TPA: DUF2254 domain-containing protein [Bryobacteraceae bacterium]|nr:DUF2254 domain-containing protein [Bryobacteraceae bacterium]